MTIILGVASIIGKVFVADSVLFCLLLLMQRNPAQVKRLVVFWSTVFFVTGLALVHFGK
ncbi:MAG: hypothetical protein ACXWQO_05465 [Bdellovibrionota bacterium]